MRISKKFLACALSILMAVSMMPFTAFAATIGVANGAELKAAVESAASGDTIEFTADNTTYPGTALVIDVNGKDITIDLKGHTQYFRVSGETTVVYETALFCIHNGAKLTVKDSVGGGAMYMTYSANSPAYMFILKDNPTKNVTDTTHTSELVIDGGKFVSDAPKYGGVMIYQNYAAATTTINDGEFETKSGAMNRADYCVNDSRGSLEINGGTFTGSKSSDVAVSEGNTTETSLTINGGEFNGKMSLDITKADTEINGGTFMTYDGSAANTAVSAYLPADQIIDSTTGQIKSVDASTVARTNSAEFTSLKDALDSVAAGATVTITLLDDCSLPATYEITDNQKITIDLNGNDITTTARAFNIRHGQLTIKGDGNLNANFTGANAAVAVYGAATDSGSNYSTFTLTSPATINAPNGYGAMIGATSGASYGAKLQLGGTINSKYGVYINGNVAEPAVKTNAAAINITGTVTASNENAVVYAAGYAKWNIYSNANLTGGSGVYIKSGTMNIYGNAVITATGEKTDYKFNPNGADATGDAIIVDSCGYPGNVPTVTIKAGTITSDKGEAVASYTKQDDPRYPTAEYPRVGDVIPATSTAVFSSDVSDLAECGYVTEYDDVKGGYVVEQATPENETSVKVDETIKEKFYFDKAVYGVNSVAEITYNHSSDVSQNKSVSTDTVKLSALPEEGGKAVFEITQAPAQVTEDVVINIYANEAATTPVLSTTYSTYQYCRDVITTSSDADLVDLAKATLDYAAAAQTYFNYNTDNMATKDNAGNAFYGDVAGAIPEGVFLELPSCVHNATMIVKSNLQFNLLANEEINVEYSNCSAEYKGQNGDFYVVNVPGIAPADMDEMLNIETNKGNIRFEANAMLKVMANSSDANKATLAKAAYLYGVAANNYFA